LAAQEKDKESNVMLVKGLNTYWLKKAFKLKDFQVEQHISGNCYYCGFKSCKARFSCFKTNFLAVEVQLIQQARMQKPSNSSTHRHIILVSGTSRGCGYADIPTRILSWSLVAPCTGGGAVVLSCRPVPCSFFGRAVGTAPAFRHTRTRANHPLPPPSPFVSAVPVAHCHHKHLADLAPSGVRRRP